MSIKVVVSTHPSYKSMLAVLLDSICVRDHAEDIILAVADVPKGKSESTIAEYKAQFGVKYVITSHANMDEYTAFLSLGDALKRGQFSGDNHFLMLHDTCEAGRFFWNRIQDIAKRIHTPRFTLDTSQPGYVTAKNTIRVGIGSHVLNISNFCLDNGRLMCLCPYKEKHSSIDKVFVGYNPTRIPRRSVLTWNSTQRTLST